MASRRRAPSTAGAQSGAADSRRRLSASRSRAAARFACGATIDSNIRKRSGSLRRERPAQPRAGRLGAERGIDLDRHAVLVLATHARIAPPGASSVTLPSRTVDRPATVWLMRSREPDGQRAGIEALDADDARGDQPLRIALDVDQRREHVGGRPLDHGLDLDRDGHRSAVPDRSEPERRSVPEPFGRGPVAEDQLADRAGVVGAVRAARRSRRTSGRRRGRDRPARPAGCEPRPRQGAGRGDEDAHPARPASSTNPTVTVRAEPALRAARLDPDEAAGGDEVVLHLSTVDRGRAVGRQDGSGVSDGSAELGRSRRPGRPGRSRRRG